MLKKSRRLTRGNLECFIIALLTKVSLLKTVTFLTVLVVTGVSNDWTPD